MSAPHFQPRHHPQLIALLHRVLERVRADLNGALGLAITLHDRQSRDNPAPIAAFGIGADLVGAQLSGLGGAIEQAKGALMGLVGCDADQAWTMLRRASGNWRLR